MTPVLTESHVGFVNCFLGGAGKLGHQQYRGLDDADGHTVPQVSRQIDTDAIPPGKFDRTLHLGLSGEKLNAIGADPQAFGPHTRMILDTFASHLDPEEVTNGSRTTRSLTQLGFGHVEPQLPEIFRSDIHSLLQQANIKTIIPVLVSSSGGGAGSALQILLAKKLLDPAFRALVMEGLPGSLLTRPLAFVADPYALAQRGTPEQHARILANAFAFRIESQELERQHGYRYVMHLGFSNQQGVVLDEPRMVGSVLGTVVYEMERNWEELMSRFVDVVDLGGRYTGQDLPENLK